MPTCFLTGATGFLGYALALDLVDSGYSLRALTRSGTLPGDLGSRGVEPILGDLGDAAALARGCEGADLVFHVAADVGMWSGRWVESYRTNVAGTRAMVDAARAARVRRFIYTSSGSTIGKPLAHTVVPGASDVPTVDETSAYNLAPLGMTYPHTKWLGECVVHDAVAAGLDAVITHPTMILGPWDWKHNILQLFRAARGMGGFGLIAVPGGWRTPCDVRDVARGHRLAAERGQSGQHYILGGESLPFREVAARMARAVGGREPRLTLPDRLIKGVARVGEAIATLRGVPPRLSLEMAIQSTFCVRVVSHKAESMLGYSCRSLDESILDAVRWYRDQHLL